MSPRRFLDSGRRAVWLALAVVASLAGCNDDPVAPFKPDVVNDADLFQFQLTAPEPLSGNAVYEWQNNGNAANVNQVATLSAGAAQLVIHDAQDTEVYRRAVTESGAFRTLEGAPGTWVIRIDLFDASGAVDLRVQRP